MLKLTAKRLPGAKGAQSVRDPGREPQIPHLPPSMCLHTVGVTEGKEFIRKLPLGK